MGDIRFLCPECSSKLVIDSESIDLLTDCPKCGKSIRAWGARLLDVKFSCSSCGMKLVIDARAEGRFVNCPGCQTRLQVPPSSSPPVGPDRQSSAPVSPVLAPGLRPAVLTEAEIAFLTTESPPAQALARKLQPHALGA